MSIQTLIKHSIDSRKRAKTYFSVVALFILISAQQVFANNLLTNPSFETGDKSGWTGSGQVVEAVAVDGTHSVRIFGKTSRWYNLRQNIDVIPGGVYRFSGSLRSWNMTTGNYQFHLRWYDSNGTEIQTERKYFGHTTTVGPHKKHSRDITAPANAATVSFRLTANKADGIGYFDGMSVTLLNAPIAATPSSSENTVTKNLLTNASFETGDKSAWSGSGHIINVNTQDGNHALRIFGDPARWLALAQKVSVEEGKKYSFSGHMRTVNMTTGSYRLQVRWYDANNNEISGTRLNFAKQSYNSWNYKPYSYDIVAPVGAKTVAFRIQANKADGLVVVDNLAIETQVPVPLLVSSVQPERIDLDSQYAFDGDMSTRWSSEFADNQWITKDLGEIKKIAGVHLHWETAYGKSYEIQVSNDLINWTPVFDTTTGDGGLDEIVFDAVETQYVRMFGIERATQWGFSLWEFDVLLHEDVALASSVQPNRTDLAYENAFDGNPSTRWGSEFSDRQWITKDLGSVQTISGVNLRWEYAFGKSYTIQVSKNRAHWTTVYETISGDGGLDEITFDAIDARYVRMYGAERGTRWGFSLWEFEVKPFAEAPTLNFTAADLEVNAGETTTLSWSTTHAASCEASGPWSGSKNASGLVTTDALLTDSSFTLTCVNAVGQSVSDSVYVSVIPLEPQNLVVQGVQASDFDAARDRFPSNAIDDDPNSKWTVTGTSNWITLDLGELQVVSQARMSIYVGGVENFRYAIDVSSDNANWTEVFSNGLLFLSPEWTTAGFSPIQARYVRVTLTTTVSDYVNLYDFEVMGNPVGSGNGFGHGGGGSVDSGGNGGSIIITPPPVLDTLSWNANKDSVDGYIVYHGSTGANATTEYVTVSVTDADFNADAPAVTYDAINVLGYSSGDQICFRVKAYRGSEFSDWSKAVCDTVD